MPFSSGAGTFEEEFLHIVQLRHQQEHGVDVQGLKDDAEQYHRKRACILVSCSLLNASLHLCIVPPVHRHLLHHRPDLKSRKVTIYNRAKKK